MLVATAWSLEVTSCIRGHLYSDLQNKIKLDPYFRVRDKSFILEKQNKQKQKSHTKQSDRIT